MFPWSQLCSCSRLARKRRFVREIVRTFFRAGLVRLAALSLLLASLASQPPRAGAQEKVALRQMPVAVSNGKAQMLGPYDPGQKLRLVFGLRPPHLQEEEEFLRQLQDRHSPLFHKYLTAEEWNNGFAPSAPDEQAVVDWAASQGLTITQRYANRLLVDVEAPVAIIQQAFNIAINRYQVGDATYFSNDRDPSVPASLAGTIHSLLGLNNFEVAHAASNMKPMPGPDYSPGPAYMVGTHLQGEGSRKKLDVTMPILGNDGHSSQPDYYFVYDPATIYSSGAYDYVPLQFLGHCCNPLNNPGNSPPEASIAIAIWNDYSDADLQQFASYFQLAYNVQRYFIDGTPQCCGGETTLDVEWTTATANSFGSPANTAEVHVYEGANSHYSTMLDVINRALSDGHARVLNMSWGGAELQGVSSATMDSYHAVFNQMVGQGWSLVAAAGDNGATTGCADYLALSFPASDPNVTAGGGTTLTMAYGYSNETTWTGGPYGCSMNDGGTGGGCSAYFYAPPYQTNQACGAGSRSVPDIALNADTVNSPQYFVFGGLQAGGGTSIVAPEIAGFVAQENAYLLYLQSIVGNTCGASESSPCAPMGNANYYIYDEGINQRAPHYPFYDVTTGCNNNDINQLYGLYYFCATVGYDGVTGWGSANMLQLAWAVNNYLAGDGAGPYISFSGPLTNHWYNTDQTLSWSIYGQTSNGHPSNGVAGYSIYWNFDPGDAYSELAPSNQYYSLNSFYTGPQYPNSTMGFVPISQGGEGCNNAIVRSWDNAGMATVSNYGPVCFDNIPAATNVTLLGEGQYPYYVGPVTVVLTATDNASGVASTLYQVDSGSWQTYTRAFNLVVPGQHTVNYYSTDVAGNVEFTQSVTLTITGNSSFTLTVSTTGTGSGLISSGDGDIYCGSICSHLYYGGSQVTLTATPAQGSVFTGWSGCDSSSGNVCTLTVDDNRTATAIFSLPTPLQFVTVTPCRIADTRLKDGPFGGPPINGGDYRDYVIAQSACGIPSNAAAYSLNITVVPHGYLGFLTAWPSGLTRPNISTLNSFDGRVKADAAIVAAGVNGAVSIYLTDTADVILDIDGYFVPTSNSTLAFYPLPPCRVADTRMSDFPQGLGPPYLSGDMERDFPILESSCIPTGITPTAYSFNLTAVPHGSLGFLTAWAAGQHQPHVSTLNSFGGQVVANAAIVAAGTDGEISAYVSDDTDLIVDMNGYFAPPGQGGLSLYQVAPCRVLDTRKVGSGQPFVGQLTVDVVDSVCGPPGTAQAYVFNATVVPSGYLGYLALWPDGSHRPGVSTLNSWDGAVTSNMAIVPTNNGKIDAYASEATHLILDIASYFAP